MEILLEDDKRKITRLDSKRIKLMSKTNKQSLTIYLSRFCVNPESDFTDFHKKQMRDGGYNQDDFVSVIMDNKQTCLHKDIVDVLLKEKISYDAKHKELKERASKATHIGFEFMLGCDSASTYTFKFEKWFNDLDYDDKRERIDKDKSLEKSISKLDVFGLGKEWGAKELAPNLSSYGGYFFTEEQTGKLVNLAQEKLQEDIDKSHKTEISRIKNDEIQKQKLECKIAEALINEFLVFGKAPIASSRNILLHSLGAREFGDDEILLYNTKDLKILEGKSTYDFKDQLKEKGFSWNKIEKSWSIKNTESSWEIVLDFLKKYDTKKDPASLGFVRCWECGVHSVPKQAYSEDYYCGC